MMHCHRYTAVDGRIVRCGWRCLRPRYVYRTRKPYSRTIRLRRAALLTIHFVNLMKSCFPKTRGPQGAHHCRNADPSMHKYEIYDPMHGLMKTFHTLFHTYVALNSAVLIPLPIYTTDGLKKYQPRLNIFLLLVARFSGQTANHENCIFSICSE
ncbi:hypothetical protein ARMGADRAFT_186284 [Armillaria gallica]|uniref:Uncharacterized protein n=1 Tax=Armillaria gallica TaxID=47427 RepID=A0A2H3DU12_ARMGA|nr:hypothetical protein ARMGADRAFT_186284 [Armillaria gallica]